MRLPILIFLLSTVFFGAYSQDTLSMTFDGQEREYILYVPQIYFTENTEVPLVLTLHGLGDNMYNFSGLGFFQIADTANFIVVVPQALVDPNPLFGLFGPAWNSAASVGGLSINATLDDVGFLSALMDSISQNYSINSERIYCTGHSMGGFMTNRLGCESTNKFAAIASVAGTIGSNLTCEPTGVLPFLHFHGTADQTVAYTGNTYGMDAEEVVAHWVENNGADTSAIHTVYPDIANDGYTVDHYLYPNSTNNAEVEFFKVNGADHVWLFQPDSDIAFTNEIWKFFSKHQKVVVGMPDAPKPSSSLMVWPNPSFDQLNLSLPDNSEIEKISLFNGLGQQVLHFQSDGKSPLDISELQGGFYFLQVTGPNGAFGTRFQKQ